MTQKLYFAKTYKIEWENPIGFIPTKEQFIHIFNDEIWNTENDNAFEIPKILLKKKIEQCKKSNKNLSNFCKELLNRTDKNIDYVRAEFF